MAQVVLLLVVVAGVCLLVVLREGEEALPDWVVAELERHCLLSDFAGLSPASVSVNSEDVVCTTHSVDPDRNSITK